MCLVTGCVPAPDVTDAAARADAASARLDDLLSSSAGSSTALIALVAELKQDPHVAVAAVNEAGNTVWVVYDSGLQAIYDVSDLPAGFEIGGEIAAPSNPTTEEEFPGEAVTQPIRNKPSVMAQQPIELFLPVFPGNHRAVVASSVAACTAPGLTSGFSNLPLAVKWRLEKLGYLAFSTTASLDFFESISRRQVSVIFIDARGWIQTSEEFQRAFAGAPGFAGVTGTNQILMTSTAATDALRARYKDDLAKGRLKIRYPKYRMGGQLLSCGAFFGVTPNFVRTHDQGRWPDRTLLIMNASKMIDGDGENSTSEWFTLLKEKSTEPFMIGWNGAFDYPVASAAMANLMELLSGANFRYALEINPDSTVIQPQNVRPPMNLLDAISAVAALWENRENGVVDVANGSVVLPLWDQLGQRNGFCLAPKVQDFWLDRFGNAGLSAQATDNAELRFAGATPGISPHSLNIGTFQTIFALEGLNAFLSGWKFRLPLGAGGPMSLWLPDGRHGPALTLFTWRPLFTVSGTGPHGLRYSKNYRMIARAPVAPRGRGRVDITSAWSAPSSNDFVAAFDDGGCVVSWSVSGSEQVDDVVYSYSGSGSKIMNFRAGGGGFNDLLIEASLVSLGNGGLTADVAIVPEEALELEYTETIHDLLTGEETRTTLTLSGELGTLGEIPLDDGLGLVAGSRSLETGLDGWTETVSWPAAPPTPPFNSVTERR